MICSSNTVKARMMIHPLVWHKRTLDNFAAALYKIVRFNMYNGTANNAIVTGIIIHTNSTRKLASVDDI
jgi:hypothetical protein